MLELVKTHLDELDLTKESDRAYLDGIVVKHCIDNKLNHEFGSELIYEAFNTIARERNRDGDIKGSLEFLKLALEHIKEWQFRVEKFQGDMQVTILSELYINICNAQLFLEQFDDVQKSAQKAIEISE